MGLINNLLTDISLYSSCFQKNENIALLHFKRKRKNRIHLNSHRYFVVYRLSCKNTSGKN